MVVMLKVSASIEWEIPENSSDEDIYKLATESLSKHLPFNATIKKVKIEKQSTQKKIILGIFQPQEVLPYLNQGGKKQEFSFGGKNYFVKMNSHRYFVFKTNRKCVSCGLEGNKFLLETHRKDQSPHFNLYGDYEGELILFTKDHIHAKSLGGEDVHSNYQTMCATCNNLKSNAVLSIDGIKELRQFHDRLRLRKLPKKKLALLIDCMRKKLEIEPTARENIKKTVSAKPLDKLHKPVQLRCDIYIYKKNDRFLGKSVYDADENMDVFASVKRGTIMKPVRYENKKLIVPIKHLGEMTIAHNMVELIRDVQYFGKNTVQPSV